ncbi:hypothetical protein PTKU15_74680 [Paraburkholderia terrae]|nr:hypothetical protein PTKU15_74680 [Paraburkholderia terrae]
MSTSSTSHCATTQSPSPEARAALPVQFAQKRGDFKTFGLGGMIVGVMEKTISDPWTDVTKAASYTLLANG